MRLTLVTNSRAVKVKAKATSTLIQTIFILLSLNLYFSFITYDGRKSNEQRVMSPVR